MGSVRNSVETVNAAATAIVTAESRVQPPTVQKRRWGSCWSLYWCFGSYKHRKRIGHVSILISEPTSQDAVAPVPESLNRSASIALPFIAPPSSPASFLQSDPPSATQSPSGLLSLTSLSVNGYSPNETAPIFTIGPYAHETQLVSPPVFSTFTTEPSTASFTPPPEQVQMTTPSSPEVPFAQLLSSSLARRNNGANLRYSLYQDEFILYQYPGSPGSHIKSPSSAISTSGTSSPFPDKRPIIEFRMREASKILGYENFSNRKWSSRVGSGSLTPNGWGSRLDSGALTPNGEHSRLGSGTLTPTGGEPPSCDNNILENQMSEVALLANSDRDLQNDDVVVDPRVSFELIGEDIPTCVIKEFVPSHKIASELSSDTIADGTNRNESTTENADSCSGYWSGETINEVPGMALGAEGEQHHQKQHTTSLGSSKEFNFNNTKSDEGLDKSIVDCEWWTSDKVVSNELGPQNNWTFFPMLQSGVS